MAAFPRAEGHVLYGGTEAEPIAHCSMAELVEADDAGSCGAGAGLLVGAPVPDIDVRIIGLASAPISIDIDEITVGPGEWGEIAVRGDHVLSCWFQNREADDTAFIRTDGDQWLRTGDVGRFDASGRVWLGGRTADVIEYRGRTIHPYEVEPVLDRLPGVRRSAMLWTPAGGAEVFVDVDDGAVAAGEAVAAALAAMGLAGVGVRWPVHIPVDGRHNSKVDRPTLRSRHTRVVVTAAARKVLHRVSGRLGDVLASGPTPGAGQRA